MQFTYEREGNDCWIIDNLTIINNEAIHTQKCSGWSEGKYSKVIELSELNNHLINRRLSIQNFPGLEDYLKENYPEVLPKDEPSERRFLEQIVNDLEMYYPEYNANHLNWNSYQKAKDYLNNLTI